MVLGAKEGSRVVSVEEEGEVEEVKEVEWQKSQVVKRASGEGEINFSTGTSGPTDPTGRQS